MTSLIFFFLLTCKHAIADLWLQARFTTGSKTNLRLSRLWLHSLDHAVLTFFVALVFVGVINALWLSLLDFVLHAIIDFSKNYIQEKTGVVERSIEYWKYASVDQILHFSTYLLIVLLAT